MNYLFFATSFGIFALTVLLLWCINESRSKRYRQRLVPVLAILAGACGLLVYWYFPLDTIRAINGLVLEFAYIIIATCESLTGQTFNIDLSGVEKHTFPLYNLAILLFFLHLKGIHYCSSFCLRLLFSWLVGFSGIRSGLEKVMSVAVLVPVFRLGKEEVYLYENWVYPGSFFRVFSLLYFLALSTYLMCLSYDPDIFREFKFLDLPVISFLVFLELGWYLTGKLEGEGLASDRDEATSLSQERPKLKRLWEIYADICPNRLIGSGRQIQYARASFPVKSSESKKERVNKSDLLLEIIESNLRTNNKNALSENQKTSIRYALEGEDVHLIEPIFCEASPVVFSVLQRDYLLGNTILILLPWDIDSTGIEEVEQWLTEGFSEIYFDSLSVKLGKNGSFSNDSVVMATPAELLCAVNADEWLQSLTRVVVVDSSKVFFSNIFQAEECCTLLEYKCKTSPGYLLLSTTDHRDLEGSLRDFLGVQPKEVVLHKNREHLQHAYHVWQAEGDPMFQEELLQNNRGILYGNVIPLLVPAVKFGLDKVKFFGINKRIFDENLEEFEQEQELLNVTLAEIAKPAYFSSVTKCDSYGLIIGRDSACNLVETVKTGLHFCRINTLLLVVSPLYMLRDYLADSIDFFIQSDSLTSFLLSPRKLKTKHTIGMALFARLKIGFLSEEIIKNRYLNQIPGITNSSLSVKKRLVDMFYDLFEEDFLQLDLLREEKFYHFNDKTQPFSFVQLSRFRLSKVVDKRTFVTSHRYYSLQDSSGKILGKVHSDQVYQNYLIGQVHGITGEPYKIEQIDDETGVVSLLHCAGASISENYHVKTITILPKGNYHKHETSSNEIGDGEVSGRIFFGECEFVVRVDGYHSITDTWGDSKYTPLDEFVERTYKYGRFLQLDFSFSEQSSLQPLGIAETFALLLQGIMPTIFPETYRSLCVTCPGLADSPARKNEWSAKRKPFDLLPVVEGLVDDQTIPTNGFSVYMFEDAEFDLGMVKTVADQWKILFTILEDYLYWLEGDNSSMSVEKREKFLRFGKDSLDSQLKLSSAREILDYLLRNERDTLRKIKVRSYKGLDN